MALRKRLSIVSFFLIVALFANLLNVQLVLADGETPTEPPAVTEVETELPTESTPEPVSSPVEATPIVEAVLDAPAEEEEHIIDEETPVEVILSDVPQDTNVVVLDEEGQQLSLASQEAADALVTLDPIWCPASVNVPIPSTNGCSTSYSSFALLLTAMRTNPQNFDEDGTIFLEKPGGQGFTSPFILDNSAQSLNTAYATLSTFNLAIRGGWNGGNTGTLSGSTNFATSDGYIRIGSAANPWAGNITLRDITFTGISDANSVSVYTSSGDITLYNIDVSQQSGDRNTALLSSTSGDITVQNGSTFDGATNGNSESRGFAATTASGSINVSNTTFTDARDDDAGQTYDGATLSAPIVTLTNVTATNNDGDGITINNVNTVTLNNVNASDNGTNFTVISDDGSGVLINGNPGANVFVNGGIFNNNEEYGIQAGNPANVTIYEVSAPTCTGNPDGCSNETFVKDNTPPEISYTLSGPAGANGWYIGDVTVDWTVSDPQSSYTVVGCADTTFTSDTALQTVSCSATSAGGTSNQSVDIKRDATPPTAALSVIGGTQGSNGWYTGDVTVRTSGADSISGVSCTADQILSTETAGLQVSGSCTNGAGLVANASLLTIKLDKTGPTITYAGRTAPNTNGWNNDNVTVNWTCADSLSGPVSDTASQMLTSEGAGQLATGTCTDLAGNTASDTQGGISIDTTVPLLTLPLDITAEATSASGASVTFSASVADNLDPSVAISCNPASGSNFSLGTTQVNCSSTDAAGNTANGSFQVTVQDTTPPVLSLPGNIASNASSPSGALVTFSASASDLVDGSVPVTCNPNSGSTFPLGPTTVACSATDQHGNSSSGSFTVNIQDPGGPMITVPSNMTVEATSAAGRIVQFSASAVDVIDGTVGVTCDHNSGETFPLGSTTVTCSAKDSSNITNSVAFTVTVQDTTAPTITPHADFTTVTVSSSGIVVNYNSPTTSDAVDGPGVASCLPASGSVFPIGDTEVTCTITDSYENTASSTFTIYVTLQQTPGVTLTTSTAGSSSSVPLIPVTTGPIELACNSTLWSHSIKLSFMNLCDHQAALHKVDAGRLPGKLPAGFSFVMGLDVDILAAGQGLKALPTGAGIQMDFPLYQEARDQFMVLYWDEAKAEWIEVSMELNTDKLSESLKVEKGEELYQLTGEGLSNLFYQILTTDHTGIFVLVKK
ncbi:MAG TPA: HYR domain-containing protein [Anaerolineales bacterium]|nr:HYR domain-containing protein [Anaerolineales bacterium]